MLQKGFGRRSFGVLLARAGALRTADAVDFDRNRESRGMIGAEAWVRDGSWAAKGLYPLKHRVWGKRAGVLGLGRIARQVAHGHRVRLELFHRLW